MVLEREALKDTFKKAFAPVAEAANRDVAEPRAKAPLVP